ncbi:hypothetical protein PTSG_04574 [Salpingoeca rosetta]|uniref:Uncharacterized protein n=1 Tax=Salpingoeca rosetta (strain ATCC 50818 / BSB-021) TaxID=946362 RepID=F2U7U1_SALR5|nr:uncharacterized protein PTSG_04574 [Salpingoeca rosetta]EGD72846.1 hypothetical protein PTSG_04574 [Salpingoeca rosetta]|eukprot:XP_004994669.1 hypothetical protein PTSG_04574 [Salpingoeca rosetta]
MADQRPTRKKHRNRCSFYHCRRKDHEMQDGAVYVGKARREQILRGPGGWPAPEHQSSIERDQFDKELAKARAVVCAAHLNERGHEKRLQRARKPFSPADFRSFYPHASQAASGDEHTTAADAEKDSAATCTKPQSDWG